jgi:site-specific recombinase XerD
MKATPSFATLLQRFFTERLMQQRQASPHTISSYRDTFRLLLKFTSKRLRKPPDRIAFEDIDAPRCVPQRLAENRGNHGPQSQQPVGGPQCLRWRNP